MAARVPSFAEASALSLAMAVVSASPAPLLLLDADLRIVAASLSFATAFEIDRSTMVGQPLARLGAGEWDMPELRSLLSATASGATQIDCYELGLVRPGRETLALLIHAQQLSYLDAGSVRLLVAVQDITGRRADAKAQADTLRQNLLLLKEVRHRVANSLQIIASVLLQHARKTPSDEARGHLKDAHNRVMSVGALERQLSISGEADVELIAYLTQLCGSIAASMIDDRDKVSLVVTGTGGVVDARMSACLGLIVTELVINALKYAFPNGRAGVIVVDCAFHDPTWSVSVSDDGIGMPVNPADIRVGLGTSIVEALAQQLEAVVNTSPERPGTCVSVTHNQAVAARQGGGVPKSASHRSIRGPRQE